ncbi:hypothetical protein MRB53_009321 [Persea americana]|uniref:Uncharacterized protein n=1 Tax=Persea americana TaxID=3435 RepID=A0ACC2LPS9_PERAE|nr:hypothetical protein MRB53_009321 [Persea americana]
MDKNRPSGEQNLVAWARPYLGDKRKLFQIVDPRLQLNYSIKGVQKVAQLAYYCLSRDPKSRPSMDEVVKGLTPLQDLNDLAIYSYHSRSSQQGRRKKKADGNRQLSQTQSKSIRDSPLNTDSLENEVIHETNTWNALKMALSFNNAAAVSYTSSQFCCRKLNKKHRALIVLNAQNKKKPILRPSRSVLGPNIGSNGNGATEPARILLERLFAQTQKLEEQMSKDPSLSEDVSINLESLELDLQNALTTLRKKEEDLQNAEMAVLLEYAELDRAKRGLDQRQEEILAAYAKYEKMEGELKQANDDLVSQARQIEDLKLLVEERDRDIASGKLILLLKEEELNKLRNELMKKHEEAKRMSSELESRELLFNEADAVIEKQETVIQELQRSVGEKEHELKVSIQLRRAEEERLKVAETNLEKRTVEWLLQQEELQKLGKEASKHMNETEETLKDFKRLRELLSDVRSELVSSQKVLASSRGKMEDQEQQLEKQLTEISELKVAVTSYTESLKEAHLEVEAEGTKLRVEQARNKELEEQLSVEQDLVRTLEQKLNGERYSLEKATQDIALLQEELEQKTREFDEAQNLLEVKESELVEARMQIQHLKSVQTSLQLILEARDSDLSNAQIRLVDLNNEVEELKDLMSSKENQLVQATKRLQEKEEHMQTMWHELDDTKGKFSEARSVVERIAELTNQLVISAKDDNENITAVQVLDKPVHDFVQKQLETELETMKESLRTKEMELMAVKRALSVKDEELKMILDRLDAKEREMKEMKEEKWKDADILKEMYALVEEKFGGKSIGDLAIEKLQLEAAQLEVEAATSALRNLAEMSGELLKETKIALHFDDVNLDVFQKAETGTDLRTSNCIDAAQKEAARLAALTEQLVKEAGITNVTV